jgi:Zinc dependent phospholipase C
MWVAPLVLFSADAGAWGLYTHIYFTQLLIWLIPVADPRFRGAIRRFPELCLAATCLPDVSLFSRTVGSPALGTTHQWSSVSSLLRDAADDRERAMAMGYACHLLADVVAHNHFVPTHEDIWFRASMVTHASSEWAMDAHVAKHLFVRPADLIGIHRAELVDYACRRLHFVPHLTRRALGYLYRGESALRRARVPQAVYRASRWADRAVTARFNHYIRETSERLRQIDRLVRGEVPAWLAEPEWVPPAPDHPPGSRHQRSLALLPVDFFHDVRSR